MLTVSKILIGGLVFLTVSQILIGSLVFPTVSQILIGWVSISVENSLLATLKTCRTWNSLDHSDGPLVMVFLKEFFEKVNLEQMTYKSWKITVDAWRYV